MKTCKKCNGTGEIIVPVEEHLGRVMYGNEQCDECNGTGEVRTNFDRITASPEALTIFIEDIMMPCYGCNVESIKNCPHKKKSGVRFCDRKECFKWLNEESEK